MPDSNSKRYARRLREAALQRDPADAPELCADATTNAVNERLWRRYALLESAVEAARERTPRVDLGAGVLAELQGSAPPTRGRTPSRPRTHRDEPPRSAWFAVATAAAAALLLAVLAFTPARTIDAPAGGLASRVDDEPGTKTDPLVEDVVEPELETLFADATAAYAGLARETRSAFAEVALLVPEIDAALPAPPAEEPEDWMPPAVRDGVDRTLDFLFEPPLEDGMRT